MDAGRSRQGPGSVSRGSRQRDRAGRADRRRDRRAARLTRRWTSSTAGPTAARRTSPSGRWRARWIAQTPELLLELRRVAAVRRDRRRGPRPAVLPGVRPHRLRQPAARGDDAAGHRGRRASSCSGAASSPAAGAWAQPGGFLEVDETVHQAAIRETLEETGLLDRAGRDHRPVHAARGGGRDDRVRGAGRRRDRDADARGARDRDIRARMRSRGPELAFRTTMWMLRDWIDRRHPDLTCPVVERGF